MKLIEGIHYDVRPTRARKERKPKNETTMAQGWDT